MTGRDEDRAILERVETDLDRHVAMIAQEFRDGFEAVDRIGRPAVTLYGSARLTEGEPAYERARETGHRFAEAGFAVVTGGGPGIMEAANRGCQEAGGLSIGFFDGGQIIRAFEYLRRGGAKVQAAAVGLTYGGLALLLVLGMIGSHVSQHRL